MRNRALVVGSVAFDVVFQVHNKFKDEVIVEKDSVKNISMMLTAKNKQIFYGGTGGNISYGIGLQEEFPLLFSVVGDDFNSDYKEHLANNNVDLRVVIKSNEYTATFYAISDTENDQIGIFQPNTHGDYMHEIKLTDTLEQKDFDAVKVAVFSPGTGESIENHMIEFREKAGIEPIVIFDPSQVLSIFFDERRLKTCIELSNIFIGNETEISQLQSMMGMNLKQILGLGLEYIIETKGKDGCVIYSLDKEVHVPAVEAKNFVEQTGAGDAFRAGLIKGILRDFSIEDSCKVGAEIAALNVAEKGGQEYRLS